MITSNPTEQLSYYLKPPNGSRHGPYAAKSVAESILSQMAPSVQSQFVIETVTANGHQVLFG